MTPFLGLILILLLTFIGAKFFSRSAITKKPLFSGLIVSGAPYIITGVILGPQFFNFLNDDIIQSLEPLISLALGWVGLLFGLQLRWRNIKRYPANYLLFSSMQSLLSFILIFVIMFLFIFWLDAEIFQHRLQAIIILAGLGCITAPLSIGRIVIENKAKGKLTHFIQFVSSLDSFWGIWIAGLVMAIFNPPGMRFLGAGWLWVVIMPLISIAIGLLFRYLLKLRFGQDELFVLVFGLVIFTSGVGFFLQLSPIFINLFVGVTIAQFPRQSEKLLRVLAAAEKQVYLFLLIFAGALWNYQFLGEILFIMAFIVARFTGKYLGGKICAQRIDCHFEIPPDIGKSLLSFGGISLAIAFNFQLFYGGQTGDLLMSATILGVFLFDEYTAVSTVALLKKNGEIPGNSAGAGE